MFLYLFLAFIFGAVMRSLYNWREGLFLMILIAAIQDPLRKLVPGAPGYLVLATAPVLLASIFVLMNVSRRWWTGFRRSFPKVVNILYILIFAMIPAAAISATYGPESWMLTLLGIFSYSVFFLAVLLGFHFPRSVTEIRRLLAFYCLVSAVMLTGTFLEYQGLALGLPVLGTQALDFDWVRYRGDYVVNLIAGFYRSPDVMGWHAATTAILAFILAMTSQGRRRWFWFGIILIGIAALFLCGRRKMVYMLPLFAIALIWLYWQAGRTSRAIALVSILTFPLASVLLVVDWLGQESTYVRYYGDDVQDTFDQFQRHGFESLISTYRQSGFFGAGLGTATPGSHHLNVARPRIWQESGTSRVLVELGVPGFIAFIAVIASVLLAAWRQTRRHLRAHTPLAPYAVGLLAFFLANAGSLVVSGQILADTFIAAFLGISLGLVLSLARAPVSQPGSVAPRVQPVARGVATGAIQQRQPL